ncbi:MAG: amino acid adenylation domain-containing protein, partial [Acidobacteriota bacterium]
MSDQAAAAAAPPTLGAPARGPKEGAGSAAELLEGLEALGLHLWTEGDRLRFRGPKGALTPEWRARVAALRPQLIERVRARQGARVGPEEGALAQSEENEAPLGLAQRRLWILHRLEQTGSAYHVPLAAELRGDLDLDRLRAAAQARIDRQDALRTAFVDVEGTPRQRVMPARLEIPLEDLEGQGPPGPSRSLERAREIVAREIARPFDLERPPLVRLRCVRLSARRHVLVCVFHHIAADGWSLGLFFSELSALYADPAATLSPLPVRYVDYARWQHRVIEPRLEKQLDFWRRRLEGAPENLSLRADHPRPARQSFRGAAFTRPLSGDGAARLESLARQEGATLFMGLLATFALALGLRGGARDLVIGSPVAGRGRQELEPLVGLFVNTLLLRVDLGGDPAFRDLLRAVRATTLEAFEHQDVPFEALVDDLHRSRDLSRNPLTQVFLTLHNMPAEDARLGDLEILPMDSDGGTVKVDLDVSFWPRGSAAGAGLDCSWRYGADLYERATVERLAEHFEILLDRVTASPETRLSDLPRHTPAERALLAAPPPRPVPDLTVHRWIERSRPSRAERALWIEGREVSWRDLDGRSRLLAARLRRQGVEPQERVAVLLERTAALPVSLLAIWRAGAAYVPLDSIFPPERLRMMLEDSAPALVMASESLLPALEAAGYRGEVLRLDADGEALGEEPAPKPGAPPRHSAEIETSPAHVAYVIYTSGSTGRPKGVEIEHRAAVNFLRAFRELLEIGPDDVLAAVTTLSFDISVLEIFLPLASGATVALLDRRTASRADLLARALEASRATVLQATPITWRLLDAAGWDNPRDMKLVCGGEAMPPDLARRLQTLASEAFNVYGPTEATVWATAQRLGAPALSQDATAVPVGRPIANLEAFVVDREGRAAGVGVPGELLLGGAGLARGYAGRPGLTAQRFVADGLSGRPGKRLYRTGDLACWRADGALEILGRIDFQVKIRGFRVELGEIESALEEIEGVRQAVVVARSGAAASADEATAGEPRLIAYLVGERCPPDARILEALGARLPAYMLPSDLVRLEEMPLTANGKVDRKVLPEPAARASEVDTRDTTATERLVLEVWRHFLPAAALDASSDFFAAGGHSLAAVQAMDSLSKRTGRNLPLALLFEASSVRQLAARIDSEGAGDGPSRCLTLLRRGGEAGRSAAGGAAPALCVPGVAGAI